MRRILIGSAAAILAMTLAAPQAMAQYGGGPDEQVDGPVARDEGDAVGPEDDADLDEAAQLNDAEDYAGEAYPDEDVDIDPEDRGAVEEEGPPPEDAVVGEGEAEGEGEGEAGAEDGGTWQGEDGRSYCRRSDGTTGLIVGGGAGALVGRGIDSRGRRGTGTIIGAIAGALVGSAIERSANEQRCR